MSDYDWAAEAVTRLLKHCMRLVALEAADIASECVERAVEMEQIAERVLAWPQ